MWSDRLTGLAINKLPSQIDSGRYFQSKGDAELVVDAGYIVGQKCYSFAKPLKTLDKEIDLFNRAIETISSGDDGDASNLTSPMMPTALIEEQSHLNSFEELLIATVEAGHLHQIALRPRLDLLYHDEVTVVARAKRLAKGALVHLSSHSECWQRQTLTGVVPKRINARFSEDDFNIYENKVYAKLLDKTVEYLSWRVSVLGKLKSTVDRALKFYESSDLHYRLTQEVCHLWGKAFTEEATSEASGQITVTLELLERVLTTVSGLRQHGLYLSVTHPIQLPSNLMLTNILSHDQHYRHLPKLWNELSRTYWGEQKKTPEELAEHVRAQHQDYSIYTGLVLRHALKPYLSGNGYEWAGHRLMLKQDGMNWSLYIVDQKGNSKSQLLEIVPWLGFVPIPAAIPVSNKDEKRIIAWPNLTEDDEKTVQYAYKGAWIELSPFDLYSVERFGYLIDQLLQKELVSGYAKPISKVPNKSLNLAKDFEGVVADSKAHTITLVNRLQKADYRRFEESLRDENAKDSVILLENCNRFVEELVRCRVCDSETMFMPQLPDGYSSECPTCNAKRYLRSDNGNKVYEQSLSGLSEFRTTGRRSFGFIISN